MMRKIFVKLSMLLFVLAMSVNAAWGDESTIYLASLKAQTDPASTGSGQVQLTWLDITGKPFMNSIGVGPSGLNPTNPVGPAATAQMVAGTMIAIEGTEVAMEIGGTGSQIYMTSMVYFHAEGFPDNGSYLADWTFTDPQITRMTSEMNPADPMGGYTIYGDQYWDDEKGEWVTPVIEDVPYRTPCFKVLPKIENSAPYPSMEVYAKVAAVTEDPNNLYALFKKYLLSNPVTTNAILEATGGAVANLTVTVEINGDAASLDAEDFASFTFTNNGNSEWAYDLDAALASKEVVSDQKTRITIPVTYTYKNTGFGLKNTTMTIRMAGASPSTLNVNLSANALDPERPEAFLLEGKDDASPLSGDLADILATDISGYTNPIVKLNKPVATSLTFSDKDFTLDLNGNVAQAITVSGGNVTIAYSQYGGSAASLTVNGGKAILNGGTFSSLTIGANGTVEQNGATITGAANNDGLLTATEGVFNGGLTSSKTLVLNGGTFKGATAVTVFGGTAAINRGSIEGATCGLKVTGGTATTKKLAAIKGATYSAQRTSGTLNVESGKFDGPLNGSVNFTAGYFKTNTYGISTAGKTEMNVSAGVEYNEGYRYFLGTPESALANGVGVCRIGTTSYARLEDAIAYANNNPGVESIVIFMTNNYTLPAGYYTLPANATIVVPMSDSQEKEINMNAPRIIFNDVNSATPYVSVQPTEFRRLTFAGGVNMDMFGDIELTCSQYASNEAYTAQPCGAYGRLVMEENSHITLQEGSEFRAWGFVTGKGEMDARRGSKVREMFQLGDWKGAMTSVKITGMAPDIAGDDSEKKIFPVTQYFIQNIESPVKYHPGAVLSTSAAVSEGLLGMSVSMAATDIAIVGVSGVHEAIFLMDQMADADNTWVRKWYDSEHDIQVYDINSAAHIGSMVLDMGDINLLTYGTVPIRLNSANFDLPLTSNFKIHLLSGTMDFQQNTSLLPGAEVEVDKESTVTVAKDDEDPEHTGALYVYDAEDWAKYAYCNEYDGSSLQKGTAYTKTVRYAPSWEGKGSTPGKPDVRNEQVCPPDAVINVHGTFMTATGFVYCSEHGANIFSSNEDAGTFIFNEDAVEAGTRTVYNVKGSSTYENRTFYPAKLKNGNGGYADTQAAEEGDAYCYQNDEWSTMTVEGCFAVKHNETTGDIYYAKPQEYVAVVAHKDEMNRIVGNADHTFSDAAGAGRLFILMSDGNCQWWEIENVDNLYHCLHPNNDTYYYWDNVAEDWKEKKYTITWKNWNGEIIQTADLDGILQDSYEVTYGTMAEFLGQNPTRESNIDYTYDFTGWTPALGPVKSDVTYTATFTEKPRKYTIIFQQEGGLEIERQFLTHNEVPVCENTPTKIGHTLVWSPAIAAVTGDAIYTATWVENPPTEYEVTFYDYNGTSVLQQDNVAVGAMPEYTGATPSGKPALSEFTYVFDHWSPEPEIVSATSIKSYTAVYREVAKTFTVKFVKENGNPSVAADVIESHEYHYGETPVCLNPPTKAATAQYTYALRWTPQIQTVMEDANYTAVFDATTNKYTVSVKSNPSGACAISGAGIYEYNASATAVTISITPNAGYEFTGWSDGQGGTNTTRQMAITADINLVANFTVADPDVIITWKNEAGTANLVDPVGQKSGTATIYTGATPTKSGDAQYSNVFDGWTTAPNGAGTFYKNNMTPNATADVTYYAHFKQVLNKYTIAWKNEAGTADIEVDYDQPYGTAIAYNSATPTKQATATATYTFDGWSTSVGGVVVTLPATVTGDAVFYAHFASSSPEIYTVTWKRDDGSLIDYTEVAYGEMPSHANPTKPATPQYSYEFTGWDRPFEPVTGPTTYTASFSSTLNTYSITWVDGDGKTLDTDVLAYGATPSYDGETPTKSATAEFTYTFNGTWAPSIVAVNGDATYVAQFDATQKTYTVTWKRDDGSLIDYTEVAYGEMPSHENPTKPATPQYSYEFTGWDRPFEPVTGPTTYTASFSSTLNTYTITWVDGDGKTLDTDVLAYGATPSYDGETPTKSATAEYTYTFNGTWAPSIVAVNGDATYVAQFDATPVAPVEEDLNIGIDDSEDLNHEMVERTNLVITSNGVASGQLSGAENLTLTGEAIFRLEQAFAAETWYAVAVPWTVALSGIRDNSGNAFATGNMYVIEFDANVYASADRDNDRMDYWHFLHLNGNDMEPGKLYMIWFKNAQTAVQFYKKDGASIWTTSTSVSTTTSGIATQSNWNAIANPALYYANMATGAADGDVLKYNGNDASYVVASSTNMVVGQPIFAQVSTPSAVEATPAGGSSAPYRRAQQETSADSRFVVELACNGQFADRLIVQTAEEKANEYVIGKDLAKMGISAKVAQMWMERYNSKLCKNTVEMTNDYIEYPLSIYAPASAEFTLTAMQQRGNMALYLTHNGVAIANLSEGDYTLYLNEGTTNEYGLRISARAPQTPTGIDEAVVDAGGNIRKVLIGNQVFIIRGEKIYSTDGQLVK